jgi:hypothetical protein
MYGKIYLVVKEGIFDFFGKKSFAFKLVEAEVLNAVTLCNDDFEFSRAIDSFELPFDKMGLPQSKITASGADANMGFSRHGSG